MTNHYVIPFMRQKLLFFCACASLLFAVPASAATVTVLTPTLRLGETAVFKLDAMPARISFGGAELAAFPYGSSWRVVAPIALGETIGTRRLSITWKSGRVTARAITVARKPAKVIVLPPPPKLGLNDKEIASGLADANVKLRNIVATSTDATLFAAPFGLPLWDNSHISSPFGEVRMTGSERSTHLGTDFAAPKGSAVAAINAGVVTSAYDDPIYGRTVVIDHGRGIYSLYLHLEKILVTNGAAVAKGAVIGTVGDSGLSSAPHLHLSIKVNGTSVDPVRFVAAFR